MAAVLGPTLEFERINYYKDIARKGLLVTGVVVAALTLFPQLGDYPNLASHGLVVISFLGTLYYTQVWDKKLALDMLTTLTVVASFCGILGAWGRLTRTVAIVSSVVGGMTRLGLLQLEEKEEEKWALFAGLLIHVVSLAALLLDDSYLAVVVAAVNLVMTSYFAYIKIAEKERYLEGACGAGKAFVNAVKIYRRITALPQKP